MPLYSARGRPPIFQGVQLRLVYSPHVSPERADTLRLVTYWNLQDNNGKGCYPDRLRGDAPIGYTWQAVKPARSKYFRLDLSVHQALHPEVSFR